MTDAPFWKRKTLSEMTLEEWESLCDGCAKCCLHKLEDEDSGRIYYTRVVCDLIDLESCRCTQYSTRCTLVPDCLDLKRHKFAEYNWLPGTCAYKLLAEEKDLPSWHPLVSKNPYTVFESGVSIRSYAMKESEAGSPVDHIIEWLD
ncbi:MAG: YcgN family cysteine cluster protein [Gammaproteobacteria bacterium]